MLSRPQVPVTPAVVDTISKASTIPLALNAGSPPTTRTPVQHIWVVTGPAGCGKSTVCQGLQDELGTPFLEGDDYHSKSNEDKMGSGIPLTDGDRWDWLISLRKAAIDALSPGESNGFHPPTAVVVSCSALKQKYRDVMRVAVYGSPYIKIHFIYLKLDEEALMQRVSQRGAHYMKSNMVLSQLQALEEPQDEWDAITIDVRGSPDQVQRRVLDSLSSNMSDEP